jgi:Sulfotransferase family
MINSQPEPIVVFIHIPKTAGTTLHLVIERQYNPKNIISIHTPEENAETVSRFQNSSTVPKQKIKVIKGHTFGGWHQLLSQPCAYFTLLRDPVERFISNYFFLLKKEGHPLGQKLVEQQVTIEDFVCWSGEDNYQTRFLAKNINEVNLDIKKNECTRETLEQAKKNLKDNFAVVGTVEEFDKTLMLLKKTFGWNNVFYKVKNQNKQRLSKSSISQETLNLIKEKNQFDLELYQYATQILHTLVKDQDNSFIKKVEDFQEINCSKLGQFSAWISSSVNKVQKIITLS